MQFNFEKLDVYKRAVEFTNNIYEITKGFPREEVFGITNQLMRASLSIALNLAEGSGRQTKKEKKQFYRTVRSSVFECIPALRISLIQGYIKNGEHDSLYEDCYRLSSMISGLIRSLDNLLK